MKTIRVHAPPYLRVWLSLLLIYTGLRVLHQPLVDSEGNREFLEAVFSLCVEKVRRSWTGEWSRIEANQVFICLNMYCCAQSDDYCENNSRTILIISPTVVRVSEACLCTHVIKSLFFFHWEKNTVWDISFALSVKDEKRNLFVVLLCWWQWAESIAWICQCPVCVWHVFVHLFYQHSHLQIPVTAVRHIAHSPHPLWNFPHTGAVE